MSDLISMAAAIDAIVSVTVFPDAEYIKNLCQNPANSEDWLGGVCDAINAVEEVNAVDAAPVVRCKDCICYDDEPGGTLKMCYCGLGWTSPDDYCSKGARAKKMDGESDG